MKSISDSLRGVSCAILGNRTFIAGVLKILDFSQGSILADDVNIISTQTPIPIVISKIKPMTTIKIKNDFYTGTLMQQTDRTATIELPNGTILTTEYDTIETQPFASHRFERNVDNYKNQNITVQLIYNNGLDYQVVSHLINLDNSSIIVRQQVKLTNNLPFDLINLTNVSISFQKAHSDHAEMSQMRTFSAIQSTIEEIGAPISLGSVPFLPAKSTINLTLLKPTILDIINTFVDIDFNQSQLYSTLELSPKNHTLYPSVIYINDSTSKLPVAQFSVPLQLPGSVFLANLGVTTSVSIRKKVADKQSYAITLTSNVSHPTKVRIMGYQLLGRIDIHVLPPHKTQTFTGSLPKGT